MFKTLHNGVKMPSLGLGVYKSADQTISAVKWALEQGYRHIDTAALYGNEKEVGIAIKESGIDRSEIFVTTKLWNTEMKKGTQREAFERSLKALDLDYIDLYLLHWPVSNSYIDSWKVLEELYQEGKIRAIGVCNCNIPQMMALLAEAKIVPMVNQIECHPYLRQKDLRVFCNNLSIEMTAWAPLGRGHVLEDPVIVALANKYQKTPAQIVLRWELQENIIVIPKSVKQERIKENADIFDFELSMEDMQAMNALDKGHHFSASPENFEELNWA